LGLSSSRSWIVRLDRVALGALALGLALYVLPIWRQGRLRPAFWITLVATLLHVYTSHKRAAVAGKSDKTELDVGDAVAQGHGPGGVGP
jgi:hypothetical protein